jgi:hypothetical protein
LAIAVLLLSPALGAGTARAAFVVNQVDLTYTASAPIPSTTVTLVNGQQMNDGSPIGGKSMSDAIVDFTTFTSVPPNPNVGLTGGASGGKFAFGGFFLPPERNAFVLFQMSNAVIINPQPVMISFEMDAAVTLVPTDDQVTGQGAAGDPDFSPFYNGGTAKFFFDNGFILDGGSDGTIFGSGTVTVTLTPSPVPEPASVASLLIALGMIGSGAVARRVRSYFRPAARRA